MNISGYDLGQGFVFSRNASPITISNIESVSITVTVLFQGASYVMTLSPDSSGTVTLDLQGILRSLAPKIGTMDHIDPYKFTPITTNNRITITASGTSDEEVSANLVAIDGGIDGNPGLDFLENIIWLTWRNEETKTYISGYEQLSMLIATYAVPDLVEGQLFRHKTLAKVYLNTGEDVIVELSDGMVSQAADLYLLQVDASLRSVADILHEKYPEYSARDILAYDVYGEFCKLNDEVIMTDAPMAQRFIVAPARQNFKCFVFRNRLGVPDTVFSTGPFTKILTPDVDTFISGRTESELTNKSKESFRVNTGNLDSILQINLWQDFFLSDERFIFEDNQLKKIIIEEGKSEAKLQTLNNMEFTYHLAEQPAGRFRTKSAPNKFSYNE